MKYILTVLLAFVLCNQLQAQDCAKCGPARSRNRANDSMRVMLEDSNNHKRAILFSWDVLRLKHIMDSSRDGLYDPYYISSIAVIETNRKTKKR